MGQLEGDIEITSEQADELKKRLTELLEDQTGYRFTITALRSDNKT